MFLSFYYEKTVFFGSFANDFITSHTHNNIQQSNSPTSLLGVWDKGHSGEIQIQKYISHRAQMFCFVSYDIWTLAL